MSFALLAAVAAFALLIDRIGLIADPYVAGSYAEGAYEVTLPVTRAIIGTVKPEYRGAFAVRG